MKVLVLTTAYAIVHARECADNVTEVINYLLILRGKSIKEAKTCLKYTNTRPLQRFTIITATNILVVCIFHLRRRG